MSGLVGCRRRLCWRWLRGPVARRGRVRNRPSQSTKLPAHVLAPQQRGLGNDGRGHGRHGMPGVMSHQHHVNPLWVDPTADSNIGGGGGGGVSGDARRRTVYERPDVHDAYEQPVHGSGGGKGKWTRGADEGDTYSTVDDDAPSNKNGYARPLPSTPAASVVDWGTALNQQQQQHQQQQQKKKKTEQEKEGQEEELMYDDATMMEGSEGDYDSIMLLREPIHGTAPSGRTSDTAAPRSSEEYVNPTYANLRTKRQVHLSARGYGWHDQQA